MEKFRPSTLEVQQAQDPRRGDRPGSRSTATVEAEILLVIRDVLGVHEMFHEQHEQLKSQETFLYKFILMASHGFTPGFLVVVVVVVAAFFCWEVNPCFCNSHLPLTAGCDRTGALHAHAK